MKKQNKIKMQRETIVIWVIIKYVLGGGNQLLYIYFGSHDVHMSIFIQKRKEKENIQIKNDNNINAKHIMVVQSCKIRNQDNVCSFCLLKLTVSFVF